MKTIRVDLAQPYPLRKEAEQDLFRQFEEQRAKTNGKPMKRPDVSPLQEFRRQVTESFIENAARLLYPEGMTRVESEAFAPVRSAMDTETGVMELTEESFGVLYDLFFSAASTDKVRVLPRVAHWYAQWLTYLKKIRRAATD